MIKQLVFIKRATSTASNAALRAAEIELGFPLPRAFIEFCQTYNGGIPADQNRFYSVPRSYREFHREYRSSHAGVSVTGLLGLPGDAKGCNCLRVYKRLREWSRIESLPIGEDLFGNHVVVLSQEPEKTVFWVDHELWIGPEEPMLFPIAETLEDFYNGLGASSSGSA